MSLLLVEGGLHGGSILSSRLGADLCFVGLGKSGSGLRDRASLTMGCLSRSSGSSIA